MSKIKLNEPIVDLEGNEGEEIGKFVRSALLSNSEKDNTDQKIKKYKLAMDCVADEVDLRAEDIALIKECVGKQFPPLVVGRVFDAIDPEDNG